MKNIVIACEMLKDEVLKVIETSVGLSDTEVIFLQAELHHNPVELKKSIQKNEYATPP